MAMKNFSAFNTLSSTGAAAHLTRGVTVSGTNTYYSQKASGSDILSYAVQWTGTPTGVFTLWGSDKKEPDESNDNDWYPITPTQAPTNPAGSASSSSGRAVDFNCPWKRIKYVNASGTGLLTGDISVGEQF